MSPHVVFKSPFSPMKPSRHRDIAFESQRSHDGSLQLRLRGRLESATTGGIWQAATETLSTARSPRVVVDLAGVDYCDVSGIALLVHLRNHQERSGGVFEVHGLDPQLDALLGEWDTASLAFLEPEARERSHPIEEVGEAVCGIWQDMHSLVTFIGELGSALNRALLRPRSLRWREVLRVAELVGVNALPIVALIGFLMGLIMAFQAAIPLGQFGAQIFVANLTGLAILRELGPLMTAIVVAGRSGSAFAAELGTMKLREELDALRTMGLEPVGFLVVPRVLAAVMMTPLLTIFANLVGIMGGSVVLLSLGFPLITFFNQLQLAVTYGDLLGGLVKAFVFGVLVAAIGCLRGLQTTTGPSAVGEATTRAVVSGIILIVIFDGIFSVIYFYLGI